MRDTGSGRTAARLSRLSRDVATELSKAEGALQKAQAILKKLHKELAAMKPRVTRHSRDL